MNSLVIFESEFSVEFETEARSTGCGWRGRKDGECRWFFKFGSEGVEGDGNIEEMTGLRESFFMMGS